MLLHLHAIAKAHNALVTRYPHSQAPRRIPTMTTNLVSPCDIWQDAALRAQSSLRGTGQRVDALMSYDTMEKYLDDLKQQHSSRRSSRWFAKLQPLMRHLHAFSAAISLFTQSNPEISCLVRWIIPQGSSSAELTRFPGLGISQSCLSRK